MNININNCGYSYANAVGSTLKAPTFKLISNAAIALSGNPYDNIIIRVIKVAFHLIVAIIFIIPAGILWFAGKTITCFSKTQIDHEGLSLIPPKIIVPKESNINKSIDIKILLVKFKAAHPKQSNKYNSLSALCEKVVNRNASIYPNEKNKRDMFYQQLSMFLRGILQKIDSSDISKDRANDILMELAEASTVCYPTWLEVTGKIYAEVNGQVETAKVKILRLVQEYKESIILEFCQNEADYQWHALNFVRNILGVELGLNTSFNGFDEYVNNNDIAFGANLVKWLFMQRYENVNRLVDCVQTMINSKSYDASYYDFMVDVVRQQGIQNPKDYVAGHFYSVEGKLNAVGSNFMLKACGVLK